MLRQLPKQKENRIIYYINDIKDMIFSKRGNGKNGTA